jgi:hypothetical protein
MRDLYARLGLGFGADEAALRKAAPRPWWKRLLGR